MLIFTLIFNWFPSGSGPFPQFLRLPREMLAQ